MDACAAEWKRELGEQPPQEHVDAIRTQFWASVDKRLDEAEQVAREKRARRT